MIKTFISHQIKGRGRARTIGFPTINLDYPENFDLKTGIYGVWIYVNEKKYLGAMQYGDSPTFNDQTKNLEVYLIGLNKEIVIENQSIKYLRSVIKFNSKKELIAQIKKDVEKIKFLSK